MAVETTTETEKVTLEKLLPGFNFSEEMYFGGTGIVQKITAEDGKHYALKMLDPSLFRSWDEVEKNEVTREIAALQRIKHPNIVKIVDHFEGPAGVSKTQYIRTKWINGESLDKALNERRYRFSVKEIEEIFWQGLKGLEASHEQGVIHRDLKPSNIMLEKPKEGDSLFDRVVIIDFGAAKTRPHSTVSETVIGTQKYMPPEQFERRTSPATDFYAFTLTLLTAMGKEPPELFTRERLNYDPRKLLKETALSNPLKDTLEALLDPNPKKRPQSVEEVKELYDGFVKKYAKKEGRTASMNIKSKLKKMHPWVLANLIWTVAGAVGILGIMAADFIYNQTSGAENQVEESVTEAKGIVNGAVNGIYNDLQEIEEELNNTNAIKNPVVYSEEIDGFEVRYMSNLPVGKILEVSSPQGSLLRQKKEYLTNPRCDSTTCYNDDTGIVSHVKISIYDKNDKKIYGKDIDVPHPWTQKDDPRLQYHQEYKQWKGKLIGEKLKKRYNRNR